MLWSPDVLEAPRSGTLHEAIEQSRQAHRTMQLRTVGLTNTTPGTRPDYGCVDWFVYDDDEHRHDEERRRPGQQESA